MPDKVYDYLAAGLPIISSLKGELEDFLTRRDIGIQYTAGEPGGLAAALKSLASDEARRLQMAKKSYDAALEFDAHVQYRKFADLIELSVSGRR
jgi:glycosyltransferase involved in cell wall biosynthesis